MVSTQSTLKQLIHASERNSDFPWLVELAQIALAARAGAPHAYGFAGNSAFQLLIMGYAQCWSTSNGPVFEPRDFQRRLLHLLQRASDNGYMWLAAECAAVIHYLGTRDRSDSQTAAKGPEDRYATVAAHAGKVAAKLHDAMGVTSFVNLVKPRETWEVALQELEVLAFETGKKAKSSKPSASSRPQRRLVWVLDADEWGADLRPKLQRATKRGWTRGKEITVDRLAVDDSLELSDQDRAVIRAMSRSQHRWRRNEHYNAMFELIGSPNVITVSGLSVNVVRRDPELHITEQDDDEIHAQLVPYGSDSETHLVAIASETRCEVTRFNDSHKRLRSIIPEHGLTLPAAARGRLVSAITELAAEVRIQSDIEGADDTPMRDGDASVCVQLVPSGDGLAVSVVVEPIADTGQFFVPGQGGSIVYTPTEAGEVLAIRRELKAERAHLADLLSACPALPSNFDPSEPLTLRSPIDCLELLEQLREADTRCQWPNGESLNVVARTAPSQLRISVKSAADWFSASAEFAVDEDRVLGLKRLFELLDANPGSRFLEIDDGQFVALTENFRRQLDELRAFSSPGRGDEVQIHPLAAGFLDDAIDDIDLHADHDWHSRIERFHEAKAIDVELPQNLLADLRPYQVDGFRWLVQLSHWGAGGILADDMGLGKTVQTLALLLHRASAGPALVVAPTSVVANWVNEAARFAPSLNVVKYAGDRSARRDLLSAVNPNDLFITTYGVLQNDIEHLAEVSWSSAVLDEAQAIKNMTTKRARSTTRLQADFRLVTTGTPIQNNLMDLFSLFRFVNPGLLGSSAEFQRRFVLPIERDEDADARSQLNRIISPFVLRRLKTEVLKDLPPRTEVMLSVELSDAERAFYEALRRRALEDLESKPDAETGERHIQVLAHLTRLRLACCNPRLVQDKGAPASSKLDAFAETLDELLAGGHKVLVFSQFVKHLRLVEEHLIDQDVSYQYLDGQTSAPAREKRIAQFQGGDGDVFLISLKAGGTGLNLTAADYVIHLDPWWNPAVEDQASDRAHRIGQTKPVTIYRLVAQGTIEEQIVELHTRKRDLADALLEGTDAPGRLDADELLALLRDEL